MKLPKLCKDKQVNYKSIISGVIIAVFIGLGTIFILDKAKSPSDFQSGVLSVENTSKDETKEFTDFTSLSKYLESKPGIYGLYIKNLRTKNEYELNSNQIFYGASLYKILIGGAVYDLINSDELSYSYLYTYTSDDYATGTGVLKNYAIGSSYSVEKLLEYLFKNSDNVAQNILERNISHKALRDFYKSFLFELTEEETTGTFSEDVMTSPKEISDLFLSVYKTNKWPKETKRDFFTRLTGTQFEDRIATNLNSQLVFAHKIGNAPQYTTWHDCGVVFTKDFTNPTLVCLMSKNTNYEAFIEASHAVGDFVNTLY